MTQAEGLVQIHPPKDEQDGGGQETKEKRAVAVGGGGWSILMQGYGWVHLSRGPGLKEKE